MDQERIPLRQDIPKKHCWNLSSLYPSLRAWNKSFAHFSKIMQKASSFKGTLGKSAEHLHSFLAFEVQAMQELEALSVFAMLRYCEDLGVKEHQELYMKSQQINAEWYTQTSFAVPEIQGIEETTFQSFLSNPILKDFHNQLKKLRRLRPYTLSEKEERILALSLEASQTTSNVFDALTDLDFDFGNIDTPEGSRPLSHASFISFLEHQNRELRARAYAQFYKLFALHKNTLSQLLAGDIKYQIFSTRARGYRSVRFSKLFPDAIDESVYDQLIESVHEGLAPLHRYYALRAKALKLDTLSHYDVYVPLISSVKQHTSYEEAVDIIASALQPLGSEYCEVLQKGLLGTWVDRFENKGKQSGAFSYGAYKSDPYILINYRADSISKVFTLAHEAGHSMHSWYAQRNNLMQEYQYTIFEAEIASTFNEELLTDFLLQESPSKDMTLYLLNRQIDSIIATLYRQTMFAEFEKKIYEAGEQHVPLTLEFLCTTYAELQRRYFGDSVKLNDLTSLECLRIPHFYRPFYVYKYATGISCAICLAERVQRKEDGARDRYLQFLKNGGKKFPLDNLATVGLTVSDAVPAAMRKFSSLVDAFSKELEKSL